MCFVRDFVNLLSVSCSNGIKETTRKTAHDETTGEVAKTAADTDGTRTTSSTSNTGR